jgi:hypothetical protein
MHSLPRNASEREMEMRKSLAALVVVPAAAGVALVLLPAGSASAVEAFAPCGRDRFCAYQHGGWGGAMVLDSAAVRGQRVEVANNVVSSVDNNRNNRWHGWDGRGALGDRMVFSFAPQTAVATLGSANDKIDYFRVV